MQESIIFTAVHILFPLSRLQVPLCSSPNRVIPSVVPNSHISPLGVNHVIMSESHFVLSILIQNQT